MSRLSLFGFVVAALIAVATPAPVGAQTYDKLANLTFSGPVQVPGATLSAGTYRFRLMNPDTSRNVLQVLSHDGVIVFAMFNTTPDGRSTVTADPITTFIETPAGVPPAVKSLFYGGEHSGYAFVYGKGEPNMIAPVVPQPEITYALTPVAPPEPVVEPAIEPIAPAAEAVAEPVAEPVGEPAPPAELPRTASPLPLFATGGLTSLLAGLGLGLLRRRGH